MSLELINAPKPGESDVPRKIEACHHGEVGDTLKIRGLLAIAEAGSHLDNMVRAIESNKYAPSELAAACFFINYKPQRILS
jgi:hypothetical protein